MLISSSQHGSPLYRTKCFLLPPYRSTWTRYPPPLPPPDYRLVRAFRVRIIFTTPRRLQNDLHQLTVFAALFAVSFHQRYNRHFLVSWSVHSDKEGLVQPVSFHKLVISRDLWKHRRRCTEVEQNSESHVLNGVVFVLSSPCCRWLNLNVNPLSIFNSYNIDSWSSYSTTFE